MKFISWNVNGLRAIVKKNFSEVFEALDADFFCLQETKLQEGQIELDLPGYHQYWNYAEKKGYSGTAIFAKEPALSVRYGLGIEEHDTEGRVITLEYPEFFLITCYTPNSQNELRRLDYRMTWEDAFLAYLTELKQQKPVILCGDLNVAHKNIDIKKFAETTIELPGFAVTMSSIEEAIKKDIKDKGIEGKEISVYVNVEQKSAYYTVDGQGSDDYRIDLNTL